MKRLFIALTSIIAVLLCVTSIQPSAVAADPCYLSVTQKGAQQEILDSDCDRLPDSACADCTPAYPQADNCPFISNAQGRGICIAGTKIGEPCTGNADCGFRGSCNMNQEDADEDGVGDACDYCAGNGGFDKDSDGICDTDDNCPTVPNPDQNDNICLNKIEKFAPVGVFKGSWYDIGRQIGQAFPDSIIDFSNTMRLVITYVGPGQGWTAQKYYDAVQDTIPQSAKDHMQGMAEGLSDVRPMSYDIAWDMVITLNMAIELLNMENMSSIPEASAFELRGCTGFAVSSAAGTFFGHNTDAQSMVNGSAIMYFEPDNGDYAYISVDPPGWVFVGYGLNEKGIAVTTNAGSPSPDALMGLDPNLMLRTVMEHAATLEEAVALFQDFLSSGKNFGTSGAIIHIVDFNQSTMAKIQVRSEVIEVTYGQQSPYGVDYIGSANHFVGDFNVEPDYYYESSWKRYERLMQLLNQTQIFDMEACWTVLSDNSQEKPNNNISRTGGFGQSVTQFGTIFTREGMYYTLQAPHRYFAEYDEPRFLSFPLQSGFRLFSCSATPRFRKVILNWKTFAENDAQGFNLYRMEAKGGKAIKLDSSLIVPKGADSYEFTDSDVTNRKTYYYKLESIAADGAPTLLEIMSATPRLLFWLGK
jgi:hypothetical protein